MFAFFSTEKVIYSFTLLDYYA